MIDLAEREAKCRALVRKYYAGLPTREERLERTILPLLQSTDVLLDAGCGETIALLEQYGPRAGFAVGVDVVLPTRTPRRGTAVTVGNLGSLPFRDAAFHLIVSRSVVEHLEDPAAVFAELRRVLKPGGRLVFTTPNKYYYSSVVARMIPFSWKDYYMQRVFGEEGYDHFPVFYRANTKGALQRVAGAAALRLESVEALRHFPYYFLFSPLLFRLGMLYDWMITALRLDGLQSNWLVVMQRDLTDHVAT